MIQIFGQYNNANVMIDEIDDTTREQIQGFVNNPSFAKSYIAIMPDCHAGAGACIGFTMKMNDRIIPDVVGVDIGCGVLSAKFDITALDKRQLERLDDFIRKEIPSGFAVRKIPLSLSDFYSMTAERVGADPDRAQKSIGTLGGGNHFIEAGFSGVSGKLWVTIHSGSRSFGLKVAKHHGEIAKKLCKAWAANDGGVPFLPVDTAEGQQYLEDQKVAVRYAKMSRSAMMAEIMDFFGEPMMDHIDSVHNFIDHSGMIRKGATSALAGERLIIPFNMKDGIAICVGKGNEKYNRSAPHGAGRILSRTKTKETLSVEEFRDTMKRAGVYTTSAGEDTLDEAPAAYKDMATILENIEETVDVIDFVKPVYNFKAGKE